MGDAPGPLPGWIRPLSWIAARGYGVGVAMRNQRFDRGQGVRRLEVDGRPVPVISVGNISAGGTGKSPFVSWVAAQLEVPVIAMRGYRASSPEESDEAREYAVTAPHARILVHPERYAALQSGLSRPEAALWRRRAVVVLDDGFQHRQLARDLDIVLVDATRPALEGDLLPNGWLREPASNIRRADLVVVTKADDAERRARAESMVERLRGRPADGACVHEWAGLSVHAGVEDGAEPVSWLSGRRVVSACALGNPAHFHGMVESSGAEVGARISRGDHLPFGAEELDAAALRARADAVVLSRKDFVKLGRLPSVAVVVPVLRLRFLTGEPQLRRAISARAPSACGS